MDKLYIDKVLAGDRHAFRYFLDTYKDMAFSVALSLVKQEHLAEEVAQEAFVQAYLSLANFKAQSKFSTWLYRIVVRCGYKALQKNTLHNVELDIELHDVPFESNVFDKLLLEERKQLIAQALLRLAPQESLALQLFYLDELSLQELVEITGWTIANTKVILFRARKRMYHELHTSMKGLYYGA
ncbi:sigma-70 family RNA polymerase sigma factor [Sphingobacterium oryzagri]|uniref:RNA polymerase sigma factor n=1 Tax=Sphingobacterium oryzagri TaxID=3025669 RepID=A0ABY7WKE7_9SPHI|nr:sigma-70 family RNA polymerase sigma factor [Sphingobacterium sp. KACC 22765]WDF70068.1 sigma-70 family RNA polymerase sigma factor [Sphingobacterium sp. KACC 22765]